jgi:asparagine synthase (glutamine-hydrolysing)
MIAVARMLDGQRDGPVDHRGRIGTRLVLLFWHGIVIEQRITPEMPEPAYPVRL